MFNAENNDLARLAPMELSNDDLELVLGGDGSSAAGQQGSQPQTNVDLNIKPIDIEIDVTFDATRTMETLAETHQEVVHATIEGVQNSESARALDHAVAETIEAVGHTVSNAVEAVGDFFSAVGDFFGGYGG